MPFGFNDLLRRALDGKPAYTWRARLAPLLVWPRAAVPGVLSSCALPLGAADALDGDESARSGSRSTAVQASSVCDQTR